MRASARLPVAMGVVVPVAALLVAPQAVLGLDALFHVLWGRDLAAGRLPVYDPATAPTPHPLQLLLAALLAPLGPAASDAFRLVHLAALGAVAAGLLVLGRRLGGTAVGVLAALLVVAQPYVVDLAHRGQADVPALALVVWAAVLEHDRPRRGAPVLVLLALAGLLRPEAWLLAGAYWLWCLAADRRRAVLLLPLVLAGPGLWALTDLVIAGDPLWSFTQTSDITERIDRRTGLGEVLPVGRNSLRRVLGPVPPLVGALGLVLLARRDPRRAAVPLVLVGLGALGYLLLAVAELSLQPRYLLTGIAGLVLVVALVAVRPATAPVWERSLGAVLLVALAVGAVVRLPVAADARAALVAGDRSLYDVLAAPEVRAALRRCGPLAVATPFLVPHAALALGVRSQDIAIAPVARGLFLGPTPTGSTSVAGGPPGVERDLAGPPLGAVPVLVGEHWEVRDGCRSAAAG